MIALRSASFALVALASANAAASPVAVTEHVRAELIADVSAAKPGSTVTIGINKRIKPRWHTYWQNSGDAGQATAIQWTLPSGAAASDILWPYPTRIDAGPVTTYGYENDVTLLTEISIPANARPGSKLPIKADVDWLVCEEICIPEQVSLSLDIAVADTAAPSPQGAARIEVARSKLAVPSPWPVSADIRKDGITLKIVAQDIDSSRIERISFFPQDWGAIEHAAQQQFASIDGNITLELKRPAEQMPERLRGVVVLKEKGVETPRALSFDIPGRASAPQALPRGLGTDANILLALLWALLGGLILNLMPCVFPVLSIKVLSLVAHSRLSPGKMRLHGLAYTAGVLASFLVLAGLLVALKAAGAQIGWGFQFQSPLFVLLLAYLMFAVGLSQSGLLTVGSSFTRLGNLLSGKDGYAGSVLSGVLAAVVATPCTAPFMGAAIAYALTQSAPALVAVFSALGLGLALPYLALTAFPRLLRFLPRPGAWMETFKQIMAFPMYGAAVWLLWVLGLQAGNDAVAAALAGMVLIAFAGWLFAHTRSGKPVGRRWGTAFATLAAIGALGAGITVRQTAELPQTTVAGGVHFEPYTQARLDALRAEGKPVFLNFTAAWCITCLVNEKVALNQAPVREAFAEANIVYLKGDWTRQDPAITAKLAEFSRNGVPLYVFYPAGRESRPVVLPQILTPAIVLRETGQVRTAERSKP
jgi:thiol:disulfide interchange protein DsbD